MSRYLATRSVPLGKETRDAWSSAGITFVKRRNHGDQHIRRITERIRFRGLINLGSLDLDFTGLSIPVFNLPASIRAVSSPGSLRGTLGNDFVPPVDVVGPHWHKQGGWGGKGVEYCSTQHCGKIGTNQKHIEGTEYRIITVGNAVVQAAKKEKVDWANGRHHFKYVWVGLAGVAKRGFLPHIKAAAERIPNVEQTVLGWDIIHDGDRVWTIEINTSPGVNDHTAGRIVQQIEKVI